LQIDDSNILVVSQKRFVDEPILICLVVCFLVLKKVDEQQLRKMVRNIKNIMAVLQIKHCLTTMEKKKRIEQASEDIRSFPISEVFMTFSRIYWEA
jgi:hypothetical protein